MWAEGCRSRAGEVGLCAGVAGREEHDLAPGVTWGWCPELPGRALRERDQMTPDPSPGLREVRGQEGENGLRTGVVSTLRLPLLPESDPLFAHHRRNRVNVLTSQGPRSAALPFLPHS